jgi:MoaA/NifB/PqqE/SkfB family radical SAM enzyme
MSSNLLKLLNGDTDYYRRFEQVRNISSKIRASEYLITNACNIRCKGCWFFEFEFEKKTRDLTDLEAIRVFLNNEIERGINTSLIIGGEPTLFIKRLEVFADMMPHNTISTNGLNKMPMSGFEDFAVLISLFGGGDLDDNLRAIKPNGERFSGLFQTALSNYRIDPRAHFVYAVTEDGIDYIEDTVKRICDNGNTVSINFYSKYGSNDPLRADDPDKLDEQARLMDEVISVRDKYPTALVSHPYYIRTMITGNSHWGSFGYNVCPSISVDHKDNADRIKNGNPVLPNFNAWASDCETINFCCTSGHCQDCRDSQAVMSWLMVSQRKFIRDPHLFKIWIEIAESYWNQFVWAHNLRNQPPALMAKHDFVMPAVAAE